MNARRAAAWRLPALLMLAIGLLLPALAAARSLPPAVETLAGPLRLAGEGEMRWFGLKLYDAALWVEPEVEPVAATRSAGHALALRYARAIDAGRLVDTSIDEMRRIGGHDEASLARWRTQLMQALPSVAAGDTLVGLHRPGRGASFWHEGRLTAHVADPALARAFFAIWLDARTRAPALRARLLGLDGASR